MESQLSIESEADTVTPQALFDAEVTSPGKYHPLLNPVILSNVFKYCALQELANCRFVSKTWYKYSLERWRRNALIILNVSDDSALKHKEFFGGPISFRGPWKLETNTGCPYRRIKIVGVLPCEGRHGTYFWNTFGPELYELFIDCHPHTWRSSLYTILFEKTPNLRKLILDGGNPSIANYSVPKNVHLGRSQKHLKMLEVRSCSWLLYSPINWKTFLSFFSKLENMNIPLSGITIDDTDTVENDYRDIYQRKQNQSINNIFKAIRDVRKEDANLLCIQHLNTIPWHETDTFGSHLSIILPYLKDLELPLKTLKLNLGYYIIDDELLNIINFHAETLQTLEIRRGYRPRVPLFHFLLFSKRFESLHTLELLGPFLTDLNFLKYTPNLKKLYIRSHHSSYGRYSKEDDEGLVREMEINCREFLFLNPLAISRPVVNKLEGVKLPCLVELDIPILGTASIVQCLAEAMPFLQVLKGKVLSKAFPEICNQWGNTLRELTLYCGSNIEDEVITGMSYGWNGKQWREDLRKPNVTFLKELEVFVMEEYTSQKLQNLRDYYLPHISALGVLYGFVEMRKLHTLKIQTALEIGKDCLQLMKKKISSVTVSKCSATKSASLNILDTDQIRFPSENQMWFP